MKIHIHYPDQANSPVIDVEDTPQNCALLLSCLNEARAKPLARVVPPEKHQTQTVSPGARVYRGRSNRRGLVLETMRHLKTSGIETPRLSDIKERFHELYPEESVENLEQVVRDLANKTSLVLRWERGTFKLAG